VLRAKVDATKDTSADAKAKMDGAVTMIYGHPEFTPDQVAAAVLDRIPFWGLQLQLPIRLDGLPQQGWPVFWRASRERTRTQSTGRGARCQRAQPAAVLLWSRSLAFSRVCVHVRAHRVG
jgi:hypothetical protein